MKKIRGHLAATISLVLTACTVATPAATPTLSDPVVTISTPTAQPATAVPSPAPILTPTATPTPSPYSLVYAVLPQMDAIYRFEGGQPKPIISGQYLDQPKLSSDGQLLAYFAGREVWTANSDGTNQHRLLEAAIPSTDGTCSTKARFPRSYFWQPATHVLFVITDCTLPGPGGEPPLLYNLLSIQADTGQVTKLFDGANQSFTLSPNGQYVVISRPTGLDLAKADGTFIAKDLLTYEPVEVPFGSYLPQPDWLADSSSFRIGIQIGKHGEPDSYTALYQATPTGAVTPYGQLADALVFGSTLDFSPNGQIGALLSQSHLTLFKGIPLKDSQQVLAQFDNTALSGLSWSPNSNLYAFSNLDQEWLAGTDGTVTAFAPTLAVYRNTPLAWWDDQMFIFVGHTQNIYGLYLQKVGADPQLLIGNFGPNTQNIHFDFRANRQP